MTVINLLAPIFLVIALGAGLQRGGMMSAELVAGVNKLLFWVGLPAAVFHTLVEAGGSGSGFGGLLIAMAGATLIVAALGWFAGPLMGIKSRSRGTFVQAAFRGNLSFIALPLLLTVPGVPLAKAMWAVAPMIILNNALTVVVLAASQTKTGGSAAATIAKQVFRNPIIIAAIGGIVFSIMGWGLPVAISTTLQALGRMSLPLALLCIGAALMTVPVSGNRAQAGMAAVHKVVLSPVMGYVLGRWLGLDNAAMLALLICLACPTAAISYTMAKQMGGDEALAATAVVYSAVASAISLAVVIAMFAV
ncbi:MAG: AEC family transporter [Opitutaceae bacterium]|nr:AEC family transporter [Opitutaceae bacterium]